MACLATAKARRERRDKTANAMPTDASSVSLPSIVYQTPWVEKWLEFWLDIRI